MKPLLLDLFCGAGGASMGYHRSGFQVVGVDINPQPNYPFSFIQGDALKVMHAWLAGEPLVIDGIGRLSPLAAIHASPPCQAHTTMSNRWRGKETHADTHVDLIPDTRKLLIQSGLPYVIENVPGARKSMRDCFTLTGEMFGLGVHRPRLFECNWFAMVPPRPRARALVGVYGRLDGRRLMTRSDGSELRAPKTLEKGREAMGIDWMDWRELAESIPPAYTEWIGERLIQHAGLFAENAA